jgi:hypothetical protein
LSVVILIPPAGTTNGSVTRTYAESETNAEEGELDERARGGAVKRGTGGLSPPLPFGVNARMMAFGRDVLEQPLRCIGDLVLYIDWV